MTDNTLSPEDSKPVKRGRKAQPKRQEIGGNELRSRISYADRRKINVKDQDPNFKYRWVNIDNDRYAGRIDRMKEIGYTVVNDDMEYGDAQGVGASELGGGNTKHVGHGTKAVLMRIPKEYYEQDMAEKQAEVDRTEAGMVDDENLKGPNMYGDGLKISSQDN